MILSSIMEVEFHLLLGCLQLGVWKVAALEVGKVSKAI
jgi:hypothetical protein